MKNLLRPWEDVVSGFDVYEHEAPFVLDYGYTLPGFTLAYETWGTLSPQKDNAILLHTGLSASSHAKSHHKNTAPGWWEAFIGPGRALDTDRFFVICTNVLGGCYGSTGPSSHKPKTTRPYATDFPILTVCDMVRAQTLLLDKLGIEVLHASVGSSLGGMQSISFSANFAERTKRMVSISAAVKSNPQTIAMRYVQRAAIMADPDWNNGRYYDVSFPHRGMKVAREIGTITYRSGPEWDERFGRARNAGVPNLAVDFEIESYLSYQGAQFCRKYDANSLLYISKAMDLFDCTPCMPKLKADALVIGVTSDILFPVTQQREIAACLKDSPGKVEYLEVKAPTGHDTFLISTDEIGGAVKKFIES